MKRAMLRFDRFLVWQFRMKPGERKYLKPEETNRGLIDHGPLTLNSVSVFVEGKFQTLRHGRPPCVHESGTGGARFLDADSFLGHAIECLEEGTYHCITPRDRDPVFWDREVLDLEGGRKFSVQAGSYVYVAEGGIRGFEDRLINIEATTMLEAAVDSLVVVMWLDEPSL